MMMTMTTLMMMISKPQSFVHSPRDDAIDYDGYDVDNDDDDGADEADGANKAIISNMTKTNEKFAYW